MAERVLIVDDDPVQRRLLEAAVTRLGFAAICAEGGERAMEILTGGDKISLAILDLVMPDLDGMGVLAAMRDRGVRVPVIVQTAQGGIDTVVGAMRAGAVDFAVKPVSPERLKVSIANAMKLGALETEINRIRKSASGNLTFKDMICDSERMAKVIRLGQRAASSSIPILIEGESGVGKEIIARAIQGSSERARKPFITVNCGAIPESLVESILFGHEKGAFTGANDKHIGKFKEADGGTLFLDEVGELPADIQVKLLRAIQEGEIDPVGSSKPVKTDFRLISATNRNLIEEVKAGNFREDLYYRLNVFPIWVPPLRERREDIPALVRHFTARFAAEEGRAITGASAPALNVLCRHDWPGNIRQLENAIFRAVVLASGDELTVDDFPQIANSSDGARAPESSAQIERHAAPSHPQVAPGQCEPPTTIPTHLSQPVSGLPSFAAPDGHLRSLQEIEREMIVLAIERYDGRMTEIARRLGIGRSTLYRKLREFGLDQEEPVQVA